MIDYETLLTCGIVGAAIAAFDLWRRRYLSLRIEDLEAENDALAAELEDLESDFAEEADEACGFELVELGDAYLAGRSGLVHVCESPAAMRAWLFGFAARCRRS